jgi:hypothetical protein
MLDEWLLCQGKWLYLEPIFSAEEIMKQIPTEGAAFKTMDRTWRDIMQKVGCRFASFALLAVLRFSRTVVVTRTECLLACCAGVAGSVLAAAWLSVHIHACWL